MKCIALVLLTLSAAAACGDNNNNSGNPDGPGAPVEKAAVVAGDFAETGVLTTIAAPTMDVAPNAVAGVAGADPVIRRLGDELFVINRFGGDNVTIVDATTLALVAQLSTGAGSNPQDVAAVGRKLYLPAYGGAGVVVIDRDAPTPTTEISLADLDPNDDLPNCNSAYAVGDRVFVTCQLLMGFTSVGPGKLVVIDTADDSVETSIDLPTPNPQGFLAAIGDDLYVSGVDYVDPEGGCLAKITTGETPTATCAIDNGDTSGYVNHVAAAGDGTVFAAINWYDTAPPYAALGTLHSVDLATGELGPSLLGERDVPRDFTICGEYLFLSDKAANVDGLRVFHVESGELVEVSATGIEVGLPPGIGDGIACMNVPT